MTPFPKTAKAFLAEEKVLWDVIDALAEEMPGDASASSINECVGYLKGKGVDKAGETIKNYRLAGRYVESAKTLQRPILRAQSATTVINFAVYGVSQSDAIAALRDYQSRTGRDRMGSLAVRQQFSQAAARVSRHPEDWSAADWATFDKKVVEASRLLIRAGHLQDKGFYAPSVAAAAMLAILNPGDLDDEFRKMLEQERR